MSAWLERIDTVFVQVEDLEKAVRWYKDTLGVKLRWRDNFIATFQIGDGSALTLAQRDQLQDGQAMFNFFTAHIEQAHAALQDRGVRVGPIRDYGTVTTFDFVDEDGNRMNVCTF